MQFFASYNANVEFDPGEWARAREAEGYDGIGVSDHLWVGRQGQDGMAYPHLWVTATQIACATRRVVVASSFANNLFRSPVEFAQASLALQRASGGRFEAGLGAGWAADELLRTGRPHPDARTRARMFREAMQIARELLRSGTCRFQGEYYRVEIGEPGLAPRPDPPPPLVAATHGPWTMRHVAPLADRVELGVGASVRGGELDFGGYAGLDRDDLARMVDRVRAARADLPVGFFLLVGVGEEKRLAAVRRSLGGGFFARFVGPAEAVAEALASLGPLGIDRVQLTEFNPEALARLAPLLAQVRGAD